MKKELREQVYEKYDGHCAYCGKVIAYKEMQIDHIIPKRNFNFRRNFEVIVNLTPSCSRCNHYKRAHSLKVFRVLLKTLHERIQEQYINKVGLDYGIIQIKPFDGVFYYEKDN